LLLAFAAADEPQPGDTRCWFAVDCGAVTARRQHAVSVLAQLPPRRLDNVQPDRSGQPDRPGLPDR